MSKEQVRGSTWGSLQLIPCKSAGPGENLAGGSSSTTVAPSAAVSMGAGTGMWRPRTPGPAACNKQKKPPQIHSLCEGVFVGFWELLRLQHPDLPQGVTQSEQISPPSQFYEESISWYVLGILRIGETNPSKFFIHLFCGYSLIKKSNWINCMSNCTFYIFPCLL